MTYLISDIHGEYELFMRLMEKIRYGDGDTLIVCGDLIDKGTSSVRLAKAILSLPRAYCVMGNHEYLFFKYYLSKTEQDALDFDLVFRELQAYFPEDGALLDWDTVDALVNMPFYLEGEDFFAVHAGIPVDKDGFGRHPSLATPEELVYNRRFMSPDCLPKGMKCIFFGHTPTFYVQNEPWILKYPRKKNANDLRDYCKIHLDTGTLQSGVLGCFCAETCTETYVTGGSRRSFPLGSPLEGGG